MLSDVRPQVEWGDDAERIVALATTNAARLIRKLLVESITSWAANGYDRYNDHEISFTVRLFSWMEKVKAANRAEMVLMHLQYDGPVPTREMLLGLADAAKTPRPDMTVKCGDASIHIEAKRVMPTRGYPAQYVKNGMMRFIDGRYISDGVDLAYMVGYIVQGLTADCYEAINNRIRAHPMLGPAEVTKQREVVDDVTVYVSEHKTIGEMTHYAIDVRGRRPSLLSQGDVDEE